MLNSERTQIIVLQGNVTESRLKRIKSCNGAILVTGNATFKGKILIPCGLVVLGNLNADDITVLGNLLCNKECNTSNLTVRGDVSFEDEKAVVEMRVAKVTGKVKSKSSINCISIQAGDDIQVYASVYLSEIISAGEIFIKGNAVYNKIEAQSYVIEGNKIRFENYN